MKRTPGIIIKNWDPVGYPLKPDELIQVCVRLPDTEQGPLLHGESHWISVEDHRRILEQAKIYWAYGFNNNLPPRG